MGFLKKHSDDGLLQHRDGDFSIDCRQGRALFAAAKQTALRKIDIKGQI